MWILFKSFLPSIPSYFLINDPNVISSALKVKERKSFSNFRKRNIYNIIAFFVKKIILYVKQGNNLN